MQFTNLHSSTIDSEEFQGSSRVQQAVFIALLRYCTGQENSGVIAGCRQWDAAKWLRVVRVTRKEAMDTSALWRFQGDDLHLTFYPHSEEMLLKAKAQGGTKGAFRRWKKPTASDSQSNTQDGSANGTPNGTPTPEKEGKGMETGKEVEGRNAAPPDLVVPSLVEVRDWAMGDAGVDPDFAEQKWHALNERHGWVMNGRLIDWRARFLRWWNEDREQWFARKKARAAVGEGEPPLPPGLPSKINFEAMRV